MEKHTNMDQHGRILIPASIRNQLNYKAGDTFVVRVINDELHILSLEKVIKDAQDLIRQYIKPGELLVEDFLEYRREEAKLEEKKFNRLNKDGKE
jgi:AbrB family looped-hinge helix DNA binding protein